MPMRDVVSSGHLLEVSYVVLSRAGFCLRTAVETLERDSEVRGVEKGVEHSESSWLES